MGHIHIQGKHNNIDQVRLLLESDKNQVYVLGLSETKLNFVHPDSALEINGFQNHFRKDRGGLLIYVKEGRIYNFVF